MAFPAKDGSLHTNRDTMKQADARNMAKMPEAKPAAEPQPEGDESGVHAPEMLDQLSSAFERYIQETAAGQPPDPENAKVLAQHFAQFIGEEKQENAY